MPSDAYFEGNFATGGVIRNVKPSDGTVPAVLRKDEFVLWRGRVQSGEAVLQEINNAKLDYLWEQRD